MNVPATTARIAYLTRIANSTPERGVNADWWQTMHVEPARAELARLTYVAPKPTAAEQAQMNAEEARMGRILRANRNRI